MDNETIVYVVCFTYNHLKYIRQCLEGFAMQKTDFPFRVIVHDDASTDGTADIIREYGERYPELFHIIIQENNQYSKGVSLKKIVVPLLTGKYIAICEGDDCWIASNKLQKQYDYMEQHPECSICVHNAVRVDERTGSEYLQTQQKTDKNYSIDEVILYGAGLFATNSFFMKTEYYVDRPQCFYCPGVGDYPMLVYATINGQCHYFADILSQYNYGTSNSWTVRILRNPLKAVEHYEDMIKMLHRIDREYDYKYADPIHKKISTLRELVFMELDKNMSLIPLNEKKKVLKSFIEYYLKKVRIFIEKGVVKHIPFIYIFKHYLKAIRVYTIKEVRHVRCIIKNQSKVMKDSSKKVIR